MDGSGTISHSFVEPSNLLMTLDSIRYWRSSISVDDPVVILPVAAFEQHGPHLPLSTDVDIGHGLLVEAFRRLDPTCPAWALPMQTIGASLEHTRFIGTESISAAQMVENVYKAGYEVASSGVRRLVISNSHGGNEASIATAALRLRAERDLLVVKANYYGFTAPDDFVLPESEWRHGLHGGAAETAMMLHLCPDKVRTDRIKRFQSIGEHLHRRGSRIAPTGPAAFAWLAGDLNTVGAVGDATIATTAIGRQLVSHYGRILSEIIRDTLLFPIELLTT